MAPRCCSDRSGMVVPSVLQYRRQAGSSQYFTHRGGSKTLSFDHLRHSKRSPGRSGCPKRNSVARIFFPPAFCKTSNTNVPSPHATTIPSWPVAIISPGAPPLSAPTLACHIFKGSPGHMRACTRTRVKCPHGPVNRLCAKAPAYFSFLFFQLRRIRGRILILREGCQCSQPQIR